MLTILIFIAAFVGGLIVLDRVAMWVLPKIARFVPNEYCGPDGWLIDTQSASGIFDRTAR